MEWHHNAHGDERIIRRYFAQIALGELQEEEAIRLFAEAVELESQGDSPDGG